MPDGIVARPMSSTGGGNHSLEEVAPGKSDSTGARIEAVMIRNDEYAIFRSEQGVFVHFSDDKAVERSQIAEYTKLSVELCELRYLTNQMRPTWIRKWLHAANRGILYDHNMAQALMLLMEASAQRRCNDATAADAMEGRATQIANRALEMAVKRNTTDNTIRYVMACLRFGAFWLLVLFGLYLLPAFSGQWLLYLVASAAGTIGAMFSVVVRAQSLDLKPCDDSDLNYLMSRIRVSMGGVAGPLLVLLLATVLSSSVLSSSEVGLKALGAGQPVSAAIIQMICIIGFVAGFAERLVPNLVQATASKFDTRAATPGLALAADKAAARG